MFEECNGFPLRSKARELVDEHIFEGAAMRRIAFLLVAVAVVSGIVASSAPASGNADEEAAPIFGIKIPPGYRDWKVLASRVSNDGALSQS